jgi:hypothetical protein
MALVHSMSGTPFLAVGQFAGTWDAVIITNGFPHGRLVKVPGAVWEGRSHRDDDLGPTTDILVHAELNVYFTVFWHVCVHFSVHPRTSEKQRGVVGSFEIRGKIGVRP